MVFFIGTVLNILTFGVWSKLGRLSHYALDAILISTILAGMKRSTGLTFTSEKFTENKDLKKWIDTYLDVGEWVMDKSVGIAAASGYFKHTR